MTEVITKTKCDLEDVALEAASVYRAIDALSDRMDSLEWLSDHARYHNLFCQYLEEFVNLHRDFYRLAVRLVVDEGGQYFSDKEYLYAIAKESQDMQEAITLIQNWGPSWLKRNSKAHKLAKRIDQIFHDIILDWGIADDHTLIFDPTD